MDSPPTIDDLLGRFSADSPKAGSAEAAVMIVLREASRGAEALLIERSVRANDPASGQISLPGGRVDGHDEYLRDTALRELAEEVGLAPSDLTTVPRFVSIEDAPRFGIKVGVFAAALAASRRGPPVPSPSEVASVFWLPLDRVEAVQPVLRDTPAGPREVDAVVHGGHVLWGLTLRILRQFQHGQSGDRGPTTEPQKGLGPATRSS